jgi:hypothetical protein
MRWATAATDRLAWPGVAHSTLARGTVSAERWPRQLFSRSIRTCRVAIIRQHGRPREPEWSGDRMPDCPMAQFRLTGEVSSDDLAVIVGAHVIPQGFDQVIPQVLAVFLF